MNLTRSIIPKSPVSLIVLSALAIGYTLYFAASILIPIALAIYLNLLFSPAVRALDKAGVNSAISAFSIVAILVWVSVFCIGAIAEPAQQWVTEAPVKLQSLRDQFYNENEPLREIRKLSSDVNKATTIESVSNEKIQKVSIENPSLVRQVMEYLPSSMTFIGILIFLTFFLLASNINFSRKCTSMCTNFSDRRRTVQVFRDIRNNVSSYLITITLINTVLGGLVTLTMYLLGFEDPWLWGVVAGVLNFIPYLGPLVTTFLLIFVGLTTFSEPIKVFISPGVYLLLTIIEGQILTPLIIGHKLDLNPVAVFLSLVFWGWVWGPVGMVLAIPILVSLKVVLQNFPNMKIVVLLISK